MQQVYVDPERLRDFARQLKDFVRVVENSRDSLRGQMGCLHETWRDQEYDKFAHRFNSTQELLRKFAEEAKRIAPLLERDADSIEEYQRYSL